MEVLVDSVSTFVVFRPRLLNVSQILGGCFAIVLVCVALFSQGSTGRILGSITDQTGAVIPGVTVTIRDVDRGTSRTLITDEAGIYNAPNLLPGTYTIRMELSGFATVERQNVKLEVGQDIRIDVALRPGQQTELVTVQAETPLVETNNAELGGTIANAVINDLPLNGRNFGYELRLPARNARCDQFEPGVGIRRSPRDPVGAEDNFLI